MRRALTILALVPSLCAAQQTINASFPISSTSFSGDQVMVGGSYAVVQNTTYYCPFGAAFNGFQECGSSAGLEYGAWPASGTLVGFRATMTSGQGSSQGATVCIDRNGTCLSDSTVTLTGTSPDSGQVTISDATSPITTSNGMLDCVKIVPTATLTGNPNIYFTLVWKPTTAGQTVLLGNGGTSSLAAFNSFASPAVNTSTENQTVFSFPVSGNLSNLVTYRDTPPNSGATVVFTGRTNFANGSTPVTTTFNSTNCTSAPCVQSDTTDTMPVSAGDLDDLDLTLTGSATTAGNTAWGVVFTPTVSGQFLIGGSRSTTSLATGTLYEAPGGRAPGVSPESEASLAAGYAFTVVAVSGFTAASQSSSVGFTFQLRGGCTSPGTGCSNLSGATFNIEGASTNTTGSATGLSNSISAGTWFDWSSAPVGSPSTQTAAALTIAAHM
jgi:hypothetical protein